MLHRNFTFMLLFGFSLTCLATANAQNANCSNQPPDPALWQKMERKLKREQKKKEREEKKERVAAEREARKELLRQRQEQLEQEKNAKKHK